MVPGSGFVLVRVRFGVRGSGFGVQGSARDLPSFGMVAQRYQELDCWQLSNDFKRRVYAFIAKPPASKDFEFCKQIRGSARGAPRTISEGFGRFRPKEFARYLEFARASLIETQNHLDDALDSGYITKEVHHELFKLANRAIGAATRLKQYLKTCKEHRPGREPREREPQTPNREPRPRTKNPQPKQEQNGEPRTTGNQTRTNPRTPNQERTLNQEPGTPNPV